MESDDDWVAFAQPGPKLVSLDFLDNVETVFAEARNFNVEVIIDERELFTKRDKGFVFVKKAAENIAKFKDNAAGGVWIHADQRGNGVEGVEKKVGINLAGQGVHAGAQKELLVALEVHLNTGVVPNFERGGH